MPSSLLKKEWGFFCTKVFTLGTIVQSIYI